MADARADSNLPKVGTWKTVLSEFIAYIPNGNSIPEEMWQGRHRNLIVVVLAHIPVLFLLGIYEGTEATITGATIPSIPLSTIVDRKSVV